MALQRNNLINPFEAIVEQEIIGFVFAMNGDSLDYSCEGKMKALPGYIQPRIKSIIEHKDVVKKWLRQRSYEDIAEYLEQITKKAEINAKKAETISRKYSVLAESWWEHYSKVYVASLEVRALAENYKNKGDNIKV